MEMITGPDGVEIVLLGHHSEVQQLLRIVLLVRSVEAEPADRAFITVTRSLD